MPQSSTMVLHTSPLSQDTSAKPLLRKSPTADVRFVDASKARKFRRAPVCAVYSYKAKYIAPPCRPPPPPPHLPASTKHASGIRSTHVDRLVGLEVKASASRAEGLGFESRLRRDFSGSSHTSDSKNLIALQWLPCQAPGVIGSALGLVGLVSVYCDWVR